MFRRIWATPRPANPPPDWTPTLVVGTQPIDPGTVARILKARGAAAGFDAAALSGHCAQARRDEHRQGPPRTSRPAQAARPARQLRHLAAYLEAGDLFEDNALNGVL